MRCAVEAADQREPVLRIWHSEHVDLYRWVLTLGPDAERDVFHGNASTLEQAMGDVEHCRRIHEGAVPEAHAG